MLLALLYLAVVLGTGRLVQRLITPPEDSRGYGLAAPLGLASQVILQSWLALAGVPPVLRGVLAVGLGVYGLLPDSRVLMRPWQLHWPSLLTAAAALLPLVFLATGFGALSVPIWSLDASFHVEVIELLRNGERWADWYPAGYHQTVAALLALVPWVDSAVGAMQVSWALASLATLSTVALCQVLWRRGWLSTLAALTVATTALFPYQSYVWSNWPSLGGLVLALGTWTVGASYVLRPDRRLNASRHSVHRPPPASGRGNGWVEQHKGDASRPAREEEHRAAESGKQLAGYGGLLAGGIVLLHGIEVYTALIGLGALLAWRARSLQWRLLFGHVVMGLVVALVAALPYLPPLLLWASGGGAVGGGEAEAASFPAVTGQEPGELQLLLREGLFGNGPMDVALRVPLLALGAVWALRSGAGRVAVAVAVVFLVLAIGAGRLDNPVMRAIYVLTFPWAVKVRLLYLPSLWFTVLEVAGALAALRILVRVVGSRRPALGRRLAAVAAALFVLGLVSSGYGLVRTLNLWVSEVATYTPDDAAAMAWLRAHAAPGEMVVNDGAADAGIWAPYKADTPILFPRSLPWSEGAQRDQVMPNLLSLGEVPRARAQACAAGVRYLYHGARVAFYAPRMLPSLAELRASAEWEEVFASGEAAIFRWRVECP